MAGANALGLHRKYMFKSCTMYIPVLKTGYIPGYPICFVFVFECGGLFLSFFSIYLSYHSIRNIYSHSKRVMNTYIYTCKVQESSARSGGD